MFVDIVKIIFEYLEISVSWQGFPVDAALFARTRESTF